MTFLHYDYSNKFYRNLLNDFASFFIILFLFFFSPLPSFSEDRLNSIAGFHGDDVLIQSDIQSSNGTGDIFSAYGNVRVTFPKKRIFATARQVQYLQKEGILVLMGDVDLERDGNASVHGERLVYSLKDDLLTVDPKQDSQVIFKMNLQSLDLNQGNIVP